MDVSFWDAVDECRARDDGRYAREAYGFVIAALGAVVETLPPERAADPDRRHLSGRELLDGVVRLAHTEFGPLAPAVFAEWNVRAGEDVGRIVFQLVETGQLSARPEDTLADFAGAADLLARLEPGGSRADATPGGPARRGPEGAR